MKKEGQRQLPRGFSWGPFTTRLPFRHTTVVGSEFLQGCFVAAASVLALVPLLQSGFGLTFYEAVTISFIQSLLLASAPMLYGDPFSPGWLTPALPLVLAFVMGSHSDPESRFQAMTALSIEFALLLMIMGVTGLGRWFHDLLPNTLKACMIMGASVAAFKRVFIDDVESLQALPVTAVTALAICMLFTFSVPLKRYIEKYKAMALLASLGLLPGVFAAMLIGPLVGEISYDIQWGIFAPQFTSLWQKVSPFVIGWPSLEMYIDAIPIVVVSYIIFFGDIITGEAIIDSAQQKRPDDVIDKNVTRVHFSCAIRNFLMGLFAPFFTTQGVMWTGVQVIIVKRWSQGRNIMPTLFCGISSYNMLGVPLMLLLLPLVTLLKPILPVALIITLMLTAFACAYVALSLVDGDEEKGVAILGGMALAIFDAWVGLSISILATFLLVGFQRQQAQQVESTTESSL